MFEIAGVVYFFISLLDVCLKTGSAEKHLCMGLFLICTSMLIKTRAEVIKIKDYIGKIEQHSEIDYVKGLDEDE